MPKSPDEKTVTLYLRWDSSLIDPVQYKPLAPTLLPQDAYIAIEVPIKYVFKIPDKDIPFHNGAHVFTPEGMAWVSREIAKIIAKTYKED